MENKKVSLATVFSVIAIILIIVMGALLYMQKNEADRQIAELKNNASQMQETISDLQGKIDIISNTINSDKTPEVDNTQDVTDKVSDSKVEEKTKDFVSENPKISFQYPNDWTIETNSWNIWNRTVKAPEEGIKIIIKKEENQDNQELKDLISLDWGSNVLDEGVLNIDNYNAYYKTYTFADAQYSIKAKDVMISTGKGEYYSISLVVGGENMNMSNEQAFNKYESVLSNLVSSVKF